LSIRYCCKAGASPAPNPARPYFQNARSGGASAAASNVGGGGVGVVDGAVQAVKTSKNNKMWIEIVIDDCFITHFHESIGRFQVEHLAFQVLC